jgi:hypothetical protein
MVAHALHMHREFFEFEAGSAQVASARGISKETATKIKQWLEENSK